MNKKYFYPDKIPADVKNLDKYLNKLIKNDYIDKLIPKGLSKQARNRDPKNSYYFYEEKAESQKTRAVVLRRYNIDVLLIKQSSSQQEPGLYVIGGGDIEMIQPSKLDEAKIKLPSLF